VTSALIGHSGFIGGNLKSQLSFDEEFNSTNFRDMQGRSFTLVVCAGLPAAKWLANENPAEDLANIEALQKVLASVSADRFILISTIDVYASQERKDETDPCGGDPSHHAYGRHRCGFESFIRETFPDSFIVRLPAVFGHGLKKNVIFDLLNDNRLDIINPQSRFQWYWTNRLWRDIERLMEAEVRLCNLFTEPVETGDIVDRFFPDKVIGTARSPVASYDHRTLHAGLFGCPVDGYVYDRVQVLADLEVYLRQVREMASAVGECP
jgi:dTDP-4-dehydrorhamnose reductase